MPDSLSNIDAFKVARNKPQDLNNLALTNKLTHLHILKSAIEDYLKWMKLNAAGSRLFGRLSHWHHGDSGSRRAQQLLDLINDTSSSYETIMKRAKEAYQQSGTSKHSLSRFIYGAFNKQYSSHIHGIRNKLFNGVKGNFDGLIPVPEGSSLSL